MAAVTPIINSTPQTQIKIMLNYVIKSKVVAVVVLVAIIA